MTTALIPLNDNSLMPWGRFRGKPLRSIPAHYFLALYNKGMEPGPVKNYIMANLAALKKEAGRG